MSSMLNRSRFGAHGDVMSAKPEDEAGKATLLEEIKSRARAEFSRKNLPQAEMLYSKAVEIKPEDATLHSNLAAVRLGLNKPQPALENAMEALRLDPKYAKGHYRKGQALMALTRPAEAAEAFRSGAVLEPTSKIWPPLVEKAVKAASEAPAKPASTSGVSSSTSSSSRTASSPATTTTTTKFSQNTPSKAKDPATTTASSTSGSGDAGSGMKGYKKTADGRLTTYFNNELTEEAKALIGDIAPKKLEPAVAAAVPGAEAAGGNAGSAWNKAGTWESRDMTSWAKQRLQELLGAVEFDASESTVTVVKVDKLEGDAEISFSRGKKRYLFDFRFELKWEAPDLVCGPAKGVLVYPDVGQDCDGQYDVECQVDSSTPVTARAFVDRHVRPEGSGLRNSVLASLENFTSEFYAKGDDGQETTVSSYRVQDTLLFCPLASCDLKELRVQQVWGVKHATTGGIPMRMLSDDNGGEQQREGEGPRRQDQGSEQRTPPPQPQTLGNGRYIVRSVLGTGSTASTYRCTTLSPPPPSQQIQQDHGRLEEGAIDESSLGDKQEDARREEEEVAVKVLRLRDMKKWKQLDLFQREAKVLKGLRHPGIPRYLDCFEEESEEHGKTFVLVQQLAHGRTLGQMVEEDSWRPTEPEVRRIGESVLEILTYLHGLRPAIVHRDIKPENIVIQGGQSGGRVFLIDFGGVQDAGTDKPTSTIIGTYGYMSPEQFRGEAVPGSDLYALGGTILFLLSGGRHPSEFQAARMEVSFLREVACGHVLKALLKGLLEPFPEDRLSAEKSLHLLRFGGLPECGSSKAGAISSSSKGRRNVEVSDRRFGRDVGSVRGRDGYGNALFGAVHRQPVGARTSIRREGGTLVVDIPPEGLSGEAASLGGFAVLWNGLVVGMTASMLTGGVSALFQVMFMAPFWFAGGKLGLETVKRVCVWERLEVGLSRWSLNQRWAPLRRISASSKKLKGDKAGQGGSASDAAPWEADWRSAKTVEAGLSGNTDLVTCRSWVDRHLDQEGRAVEKWSLQIIEGVNRHDFGETLPPEEKVWIAEEVDSHIQSCLRALAEGEAVVQADDIAA
eukprot:g12966.t1